MQGIAQEILNIVVYLHESQMTNNKQKIARKQGQNVGRSCTARLTNTGKIHVSYEPRTMSREP